MLDREEPLCVARSDERDQFVRLPEPLATLQHRCGGQENGQVAIPELLSLIKKARRLGLRLAREWAAFDGEKHVSGWAELSPLTDEITLLDIGCEILVQTWHERTVEAPVSQDIPSEIVGSSISALADLSISLDSERNVLFAATSDSGLDDTVEAINRARSQPWTSIVELPPGLDRPSLHWRLLDGALVSLPNVERQFELIFEPIGTSENRTGFHVHFLGLPRPVDKQDVASATISDGALISDDLVAALQVPVERIIANSQVITNRLPGPLTNEYADYALDMSNAGQYLQKLLTDLLDRETSEEPDVRPNEQVELAEITRRAKGMLSRKAADKAIQLILPPLNQRVCAHGEARKVLQIALNLLDNAISYSAQGSRVWLQVHQAANYGTLTVADQGPGLDERAQARVFDKFERLDREVDGGSGLGLYIARQLARSMGGTLTVESAPGHGARFTLALPNDDRQANR